MNKKMLSGLAALFTAAFMLQGCSGESPGEKAGTPAAAKSTASLERIDADDSSPRVYLPVSGAKASSFDQTPDWAPEPNAMAPVDGDMATRWSSDYTEGDQWIYFDLGGEKVVDDMIIRWERAYATDFSILGSTDAESWQELYSEKDSPGGVTEATFDPVKLRYVKILGTERVNEDWGISIWEAEIYGPASENPDLEFTKEEYLNQGLDESMVKEAEEKVASLSSDVVPVSENEFQRGVVYTSWMADEFQLPASDITLAELKSSGIDTIAIMVPAYQEKLDSTEVFTNDKPGGDTPTMEGIEHAVDTCHELGLRVMIKPHVDPRTDEARINIMPSEAWFDSFGEFTLKYAKFSQEKGVELFSVGTELEATTFSAWDHRWRGLIEKVRQVYDGYLTYSANWTEYKEVPFWDAVDFIGIDAYFPLTQKDEPTLEALTAAWREQADDIGKWLDEKGLTEKGILFTEIGYPSADGAATQPWAAISKEEDQREQADCLRAMFTAMMERPWFKGYYIWQYFPQERWSPLGFTVRGKAAEDVLEEWNGKESAFEMKAEEPVPQTQK